MKPTPPYTCATYREEMLLLGLRKRLEDPALTAAERRRIVDDIRELERRMGLD